MSDLEHTAAPADTVIADERLEAGQISEDATIRDNISTIVMQGRQLFNAEVAFYRSRLKYSQKIITRSGLFGALALFFLFGMVVAAVLGALLILSAVFGPEVATIVIVIVFAALTVVFGLLARGNARKLAFPELQKGDQDGQS
jgi:hypothetical protein